jgi:hypothetical protein
LTLEHLRKTMLDVNEEHPYKGFEGMLATEIPAACLRAFLQVLLDSGVDAAHYKLPTTLPGDDAAIRKLVIRVLSSSKGAGWSALLLEHCLPSELPKTAVDFLKKIYAYFPVPVVKPAAAPAHSTAAHVAAQGASSTPAAAPPTAPGGTPPKTP